ncbi:hypothetical protein MNEG_9672, partial [Monoraphidium neglectum]
MELVQLAAQMVGSLKPEKMRTKGLRQQGLAGGKGVHWIPARAIMCVCADAPLRQELETAVSRDRLLGPSAAPGLVSQVWVEVWRQAAPHEVSKVVVLLEAKALLQ